MPIVPTVLVLAVAIGVAIAICCSPVAIRSDYSVQAETDKPEKIETAISNVVSDLGKRDFVPIYLEVKWHPASKSYVIWANGVDRAKLVKYEP